MNTNVDLMNSFKNEVLMMKMKAGRIQMRERQIVLFESETFLSVGF